RADRGGDEADPEVLREAPSAVDRLHDALRARPREAGPETRPPERADDRRRLRRGRPHPSRALHADPERRGVADRVRCAHAPGAVLLRVREGPVHRSEAVAERAPDDADRRRGRGGRLRDRPGRGALRSRPAHADMMAARVLEPVPRPGARRRFPKELAPRRAYRLAEELPGGVDDPGFPDLLERIDTGVFHPGIRVEVFFRGADAFAAMLEAVDRAREEVLLESYIFKHDATGRLFADALSRAADRGVAVRVLADGFGSWATRRAFWDGLRAHGV